MNDHVFRLMESCRGVSHLDKPLLTMSLDNASRGVGSRSSGGAEAATAFRTELMILNRSPNRPDSM